MSPCCPSLNAMVFLIQTPRGPFLEEEKYTALAPSLHFSKKAFFVNEIICHYNAPFTGDDTHFTGGKTGQ